MARRLAWVVRLQLKVTCWLGRTRGGTEVGMGGETDCYSYKLPVG